jgi:polyisoprenoid-binding protein YceI
MRNLPHCTGRLALAALLAGLACGAAVAAPETYKIDSTHTYPMFAVEHIGASIQRGRFDKTTGTIVLDRDAKTGSIEVSIDTSSINMGFEVWNKVMRSRDFFDAETYPAMTFKSSKLVFEGDKLVAADGELTLLGIAKPLRVKVADLTCGQHPMLRKPFCGAEISAEFKRSDYGMRYGIPGVGDLVRVMAPVEAIKE